ncbi:alpha/beta hydrolase [Polaromonas sp. CG_9.11]|uniref:alpha/beta hydrolase n=1 Tax=Polaromonas sp. CG_9.11 TaxID=2787730 RepID=UPI001A2F0C59|nr:alpha/beta hydrolase [Polaromonas sp. CG_9.11]MBG6076826.1 acetyl esterase/lipase [Polaromonas sp. CG_9.11]
MPRRAWFAMLPALLTACSGADLLNATVSTDSYRRTEGLAYGADPRQLLDVYQPAAGVSRPPLVVFFYGGSWSSGERGDYRFVGEALASRGIVAVVADYRLSPAFRYPAFVQDSASAVRWAVDHAAEFGADEQRIFVMGHSAGAYNAAMVALDARWLAAVGLAPARLAGWIGLAGPYDFLPIGDPQTRVAFDWPQTSADSQPIIHASPASPPALLLAPAEDSVVNPQRSTLAMAARLRASGVRVESELFDGVSHVTLLASMAQVLRSRAPVLARVAGFVQSAG